MLEIDDFGRVVVHPDFKSSGLIQDLMSMDQSKDNANFQKWIAYTYHMYKIDHQLSIFFPKERLSRVIAIYFAGEDISSIEDMSVYKSFKLAYLEFQHTVSSRFIEKLKSDMEGLLSQISQIPMTKTIMAEFDVPHQDGTYKVRKEVEVDNSEEKFKALKNADHILALYDKFNARLKTEQRDKKKAVQRMFDHRS